MRIALLLSLWLGGDLLFQQAIKTGLAFLSRQEKWWQTGESNEHHYSNTRIKIILYLVAQVVHILCSE